MVNQACKLKLPRSNPCPEVVITSLLFEPFSHSLALMHSDSSILLFPSISLFSPSQSPSPSPSLSPHTQTLIPPISTSSCFLRLHSNPNSPDGRVLFVVAGPHSGGARVLLRVWILQKNQVFAKAQVNSSQNDLIEHGDDKLGLVVDLSHGISVKLVGSVNFFALHSVSAKTIWVFGAKVVGDESVNLVKCAVIDCTLPICSISLTLGFLILGEENGVRVFPLRPLVKGRVKKQRDSGRRREINNEIGGLNGDVILKSRGMNLPNGVSRGINGSNELYYSPMFSSKNVINSTSGKVTTGLERTTDISSNGYTGKTSVNHASARLKTVKLKQDSGLGGSFFVAFKGVDVQSQMVNTLSLHSLKAISVQALSHKRFLILDSMGNLHILSMYGTSPGSEITGHMRRLSHTMKVQMLAVLPDISTRIQTFWISDGFHTIHMMSITDLDIPVSETDKNETEEKLMQISAIQAIFACERIQELIPLSANAILVLGQGNIFAYATS